MAWARAFKTGSKAYPIREGIDVAVEPEEEYKK
jgi:hypothetical protein